MKWNRSALVLLFLAVSAWGYGCASLGAPRSVCLSYNVPLRMEGTIELRTHPLPGDEYADPEEFEHPVKYRILKLDGPICVFADPHDDTTKTEYAVTEIQMAIPFDTYASFLNKRVVAEGELYHRIVGHHYTPVLIEVKGITPIPAP